MTANAPKMSLEEKLVQNLKEEKLFALLGDEDALTELVKRAIHEALYQPQRVMKSYGGWEDKDSIVVASAREVAKRTANGLVAKISDELLADAEIRKTVKEALAVAMPQAIADGLRKSLENFGHSASANAFVMVQEAVRNKTI